MSLLYMSSIFHCTGPRYSVNIVHVILHSSLCRTTVVSYYMYMCHLSPVQDCCTRNRTTSRRKDISSGYYRHHCWVWPPSGSGHLGSIVLVCPKGHLEAVEEETAKETGIPAAVDRNEYFDRIFDTYIMCVHSKACSC